MENVIFNVIGLIERYGMVFHSTIMLKPDAVFTLYIGMTKNMSI